MKLIKIRASWKQLSFLRTCPYRTRNTSENPALALFSVYFSLRDALIESYASTSSIFDEKLFLKLDLYSSVLLVRFLTPILKEIDTIYKISLCPRMT